MGEAVMPLYETQVSQLASELDDLIAILKVENVRSFLEVGSRYGGSLWRIANALPAGSTIVSVDNGRGMGGNKQGAPESLWTCISDLRARGYNARLIFADSHDQKTVNHVRKCGPFDAVFIDADHEYRGVIADWKHYGPMARIVAFHDIGWVKPDNYANSKLVEVPKLWAELKPHYRHEEFIDRSTGGNYGIGVLWRF